MKPAADLSKFQGPLPTWAGACFPGERAVFRGQDLHRDLADLDWMELYLFGISGKRFPRPQVTLLNAVWTTTSYPDARIWNNRVVALAGSARSTAALGVAAAVVVSEAEIYGYQSAYSAACFFDRARKAIAAGRRIEDVVAEELATNGRIQGYGRPIAALSVDERIPAILRLMAKEGMPRGPHLELAFEVERVLRELGKRLAMNYAAIVAAVPLDAGLTPEQCYLFMLPSFMAAMSPIYLEACERGEGTTFVLSCEQLAYRGPSRRTWHPEPAT